VHVANEKKSAKRTRKTNEKDEETRNQHQVSEDQDREQDK